MPYLKCVEYNMVVITDSCEAPHERIDIYKVFIVNNVKSYTNDKNFTSWMIDTFDESISESKYNYFIIDTIFNEAFSHWVFECAVYLDLFLLLKQRYPTLKLHLKTKRTYKLLFCKLFNINEEDIVYTLEPSNISIFPSPISLMNNTDLPQEYIEQLRVFFLRFNQYKSKIVSPATLIMPRQSKENFDGNDRSYKTDTIGECFKSKPYEYFHTDTVTDLRYQIQKVSSANTIILTDGSPFLVNGMFAQNARIMVIDIYTVGHASFQKKMREILKNIRELNNVSYEYYNTVDDLHKYLLENHY